MQPATPSLDALISNQHRYPLGKVSVYPTSKSVPSNGFNIKYYGIAPDTNMAQADWWSGLSGDAPVDPLAHGTFLTGDNMIEPSTAMAFDFGIGGVPPPVNDGRIDLWAARWTGWFFARYAGVYRFYIDTAPHARVRIKFDGTYYGNGTDFTDPDETGDISTDRWDPNDANFAKTRHELYFDTGVLTPEGTWYAIDIQYFIPRQSAPQNESAYLCVKYREPDATTSLDLWGNSGDDIVPDYPSDYQDDDGNDIKKPLSAGVVNTTNAFISAIEVPGVDGYAGTKRDGQVSEYSFNVKLPASTNLEGATGAGETEIEVDSLEGFAESGTLAIGTNPTSMDIVTYTGLDTGTNEFTGCSGVGVNADDSMVSQFIGEGANQYISGYDPLAGAFGPVKPFRLIQIEGGLYDGSANDYYTDRIWGNVYPNPVVNREAQEVTFKVRDFGWAMLAKYDKNYPDQASYSMAGYYEPHTYNTPDGVLRPVCYDRWRTDKAIMDLLMKAGIDPVLLWQRQRHQISGSPAYATDYGPYLISKGLAMDSMPEYGKPYGIARTGSDEKYLWTFGFGTLLWENLSEIVKNYGLKFGFTANGFAKAQAFGVPDSEFYPDDTLDDLTFTGTGWNDDNDNISDLDAFRGRYRKSSNATDKVALTAAYPYWSDAEMVLQLHDGANQKIKIKVDAAYVTQLIINGALTDGTGGGGDEFAIAAQGAGLTRSYYDGIDSATGANPTVIQLAAPVTLKQQLLEVVVVSGEIRVNVIFLYGRSIRETVATLNDEQASTLRMEKDVSNQRNEISVVGAARGVAENVGGEVINPNNPIYIHTISRAVDLRSLYENDYLHYAGHILSTEIYDERLLDQERADYVAINTLLKYKGQEVPGSTELLFDPRLEVLDSLAMTDKHSKLYDDTQTWIRGISEKFEVDAAGGVSYITILGSMSPRQPQLSMRFKPEPDITADWDDEPIVNIGLYYRGFRVSGSDASAAGKVITIGTSPGWDTTGNGMWDGYFIYDQNGVGHEIAGNIGDAVTLVNYPSGGWEDGNWTISFDPLDAENGEPLEIRYDQLVSGTVSIDIIASTGQAIANLTRDTSERVALWGPDKKIFWNGELHAGFKEAREGYLVSPYTLNEFDRKLPLTIRFTLLAEETGIKRVIITHVLNNDGDPYDEPRMDGAATLHNSYGAAKIIPRLLDDGYYMGWKAIGNLSGADNTILDAGRVYKFTSLGLGVYRLFLEGRGADYDVIGVDEYNGKYVISGLSGAAKLIEDSGNDGTDGWIDISFDDTNGNDDNYRKTQGWSGAWSIFRQGEHTETDDDAEWFWVRIVENQYQPIMFNETDNNNKGLQLKFSRPQFWVTGLNTEMFMDGITVRSPESPLSDWTALGALYKVTCEHELTINHEGAQYTIDKDSDVKFAQFGTVDKPVVRTNFDYRYPISWLTGDERSLHLVYFVYWSKYYPTKLWFTAGRNPDCMNPEEGAYLIASIINYNEAGGPTKKMTIRCATVEPKAQTFVMSPYLEVHQIAGLHRDLGGWYDIRSARWRPRRTLSGSILGLLPTPSYEHDLPEFSSFVSPRDLVITLNPHRIAAADGETLYFWKRLAASTTPDFAMWHFLIKPVIYDRVGRVPKNWLDYDIFDLQHEEDFLSSEFTYSDWTGISAFWHPGAGYSSDEVMGGANWYALKYFAEKLNIARAIPLHIWTPT